jgi:hypothetical protein
MISKVLVGCIAVIRIVITQFGTYFHLLFTALHTASSKSDKADAWASQKKYNFRIQMAVITLNEEYLLTF